LFLFFFFQEEDGIRVATVTGVQTCALPISAVPRRQLAPWSELPPRYGSPATCWRRLRNPPVGPESIEGFYDDALAVPGLLAEIAKGEAQGVSAHVIACFDDTGLDAARALAGAPVVGIGEAAFHAA